MEKVNQSRVRPAYYFSPPDEEILEDHVMELSCDEETWLYKREVGSYNGKYDRFQLGPQVQNHNTPSSSGSVDARTFTRRNHCSLVPSLDSVVESPLSNNRSSLGLLSASILLNDIMSLKFTPVQTTESQEKTSSNFTVSEKRTHPRRIFKLNSPFLSSSPESSDLSVPYTQENLTSFDKYDPVMTDSLVHFLETRETSCHPPAAFQDEAGLSDSLISLPEGSEIHNVFGKSEPTTESLVNFLESVNCGPPHGFEDNDMTSSVVDVDKSEMLPACDMSNSVLAYLNNVRPNSPTALNKSVTSTETENIPPHNCDNKHQQSVNSVSCVDKLKATGVRRMEAVEKLNSTYELENNISNDDMANINFTVNITRMKKGNGDTKDDLNITKTLNATNEKELNTFRDNSEKNIKTRALNNRDLNVTHVLNGEEVNDLNSTKTLVKETYPTKLNSTTNSPQRKSTYTKDELKEALSVCRQIPEKNSTFNTTFTKSAELLNCGLDDDQTSSASDSSFSSCSTKPRSVDELRTIAQQQENSLNQKTSTPTICSEKKQANLDGMLDLDLSPVEKLSNFRLSSAIRNNETRSANCSPVRSRHSNLPSVPHPITKLQQPSLEHRTLQASSLSNIARPKVSGLRMPQPVSRIVQPSRSSLRPATAPTSIPRPQASRLPTPSFRGSGIPGLKRGGRH